MSAENEAAKPDVELTIPARLDALFGQWNRTDAPGLAVGVALDGRLLYRRGFGMASLEAAVANTPKTRMRIGSTSKHFACLLGLLLAEEGKLDLDAPVRAYIPELAGADGDPTLRQLMLHRGGGRCALDISMLVHGLAMQPAGAILSAYARQLGRNFEPGTAQLYNNGGYHLLSIAIERAGGAPFEDQLCERLLEPLGMADTASIPSDYAIVPGMATLHVALPDGSWRRGVFPNEEVRGEGGIVSTVDDMLSWMAHLRRRDRFGSPSSWDALLTSPPFPDGTTGGYALGLVMESYRGLRVIYHTGAVIGGLCQMLTLPDHKLDIIIMTNGASGADPKRLAEMAVDIILSEQVGPEPCDLEPDQYEGLLGDWWSPETGMVYSFVEEQGALKLQLCKYPVGFPLQAESSRQLAFRQGGMSDLLCDVEMAASGTISITFGGQTLPYHRLPTEAPRVDRFAEFLAGEYFSPDANSRATIELEGEKLVMRVADDAGGIAAVVVPLSEQVAAIQPLLPTDLTWAALSLKRAQDKTSGFFLSTLQTRGLEFVKVDQIDNSRP